MGPAIARYPPAVLQYEEDGMREIQAFAVIAFLSLPLVTAAADNDELDSIRQQIEALRQEYESRIKALEQRLEQAEVQARDASAEAKRAQQQAESAEAEVAGIEAGSPTTFQERFNTFNPSISLILQGSLNSYSEDPEEYNLPGFQLGGESGLAPEGLTLDETELVASASVDQLFYAKTTIALHEDEEDGTEVDVEEAFFDPLLLPAGLGGRAGRFYSDIGYLNRMHSHTWDFRDEPLAYRAFLGKQYRDDGVRLNWTAPTDLYINVGAETLVGSQFPAGESESVFGDVQTLFMDIGGDVGSSHAWQAGLSALRADVHDRRSGHGHGHGDNDGSSFSGDSDLYIADLVWKWAPQGNPSERNFIFQTEVFYRDEDGPVDFREDENLARLDYNGEQKGLYVQGVYQFMPRWRIGARYDWLDADNDLRITDLGDFDDPDEVIEESGLDTEGHNPERYSLMLDWSPSEFSRLRAQYNRDESNPDNTDHQWSLQYIMSLGAHGAHEF
jgi:hypothetical protein